MMAGLCPAREREEGGEASRPDLAPGLAFPKYKVFPLPLENDNISKLGKLNSCKA
jgi:hypothetical protein